jgi:hypothetical protein
MKIYHYEKELGLNERMLFWEEDQMLDDDRQDFWKEQKEKYGFDEREVWSLYYRIALFIYPRLKMYSEIPSRPIGMTNEQWKEILDQMLTAFEIIIKDEINKDSNEKIVRKGLKRFFKYFLYLWW